MTDDVEGSTKIREINPAYLGWMRFFFFAAHFVIPLAALGLLRCYVIGNLGCLSFELSWPILVVVAVALLPFLLPLVSAYVGKIGPVEMRDDTPREKTIPRSATKEQEPAVKKEGDGAVAALPPVDNVSPNVDALTDDERSVLKTLWVHQPRHTAGGGSGWWSFNVPLKSPTYKNFLGGAGHLLERKLVGIDNGMVHLNDKGLAYCSFYDEQFAAVKSYWTFFRPATP